MTRPSQSAAAAAPEEPTLVRSAEVLAREWYEALQQAALMTDLTSDELSRWVARRGSVESSWEEQAVDFVSWYYRGDSPACPQRQQRDAFLLHGATDGTTAKQLVAWLADAMPELRGTELAQVGDDVFFLRQGDQRVAVVDDELDEDETASGPPSLAVGAIVSAANGLLAAHEVHRRWLPLITDEGREPYVALSRDASLSLYQEGLIDCTGIMEMVQFARWAGE